MFETKSELRKIATTAATIITAAALAISVTGCAPTRTKEQDLQLTFIQSKFVSDTYVEGFTPGQPDYGITIEMLLQREGLFDSSQGFQASVSAILEDEDLSGSASKPTGYLFGETGIKLDLTGKYAFASVALNAKNEATRNAVIELAEKEFETSSLQQTDFTLAWLTLGLEATKHETAGLVAEALIAAQNTDGGFDDFTPGESTADATGLALLALQSVVSTAEVKASIAKAQNYLTSTLVNSDHFEAFGTTNVNGTAYAYMGLKATGASDELLKKLQSWLASQLQVDGGVQAGFALGASDTMATSQAVLAINGRTYLELK